MRILKVYINNLNALQGERVIDFEEAPLGNSGLFAIVGDTGAGKTTILDAMTLALYGKIHRNRKEVREVMSYGTGQCYAQVVFSVGEERFLAEWHVHRARNNPNQRLQNPIRKLSKWNAKKQKFVGLADKIREVNEQIEAVTGLDFDRFCRSVLLSQGDFAAFLKAGEQERSDLLERITGTQVYSMLSEKTYERFQLEKSALQQLKNRRENLEILDPARKQVIAEELEKLEVHTKSTYEQLAVLKTGIDWYLALHKLEADLETVDSRLEGLQQQETALAGHRRLLRLHQKALPLAPDFQLLRSTEHHKTETEKKLLAGRALLPELEGNWQQARQQFQSTDDKATELEKKLPAAEKRWQKAAQLDEQLLQLEKNRLELQNNLEVKQKEHEETTKRITQDSGRLLAGQAQWQELQHWQSTHPKLEQLSQAWELVKNRLSEWEAKGKQLVDEEKALAALQQVLTQEQAQQEALTRSAREATEALTRLEQTFLQDRSGSPADNRQALLQDLRGEIDQFRSKKDQFERFYERQLEYRNLLKIQAEQEEELEHLRSERYHLVADLLLAAEHSEEARQELAFKREVYDLQRLKADYEKDRHLLKDGEPCPLCGALHHPFAGHQVDAFLDRAREDWERAASYTEKLDGQYRRLLQEEQNLALRIEQMEGREQQRPGMLQRQYQRILDLEAEMMALFSGIEASAWHQLREVDALERKQWYERNIDQLQKRVNHLQQLNTQIEDLQKQQQILQKQLYDQENRRALQAQKLETRRQQFGVLQQQRAMLADQLQIQLQDYQLDLQTGSSLGELARVEALVLQYQQNQRRLIEIQQQLAVLTEGLSHLEGKQKEVQQDLHQLQSRMEQLQSNADQLKTERRNTLGTDDPEAAKQAFYEELEQARQHRHTAQEQLQQARSTFELKQQEVHREEKLLYELEKEWKNRSATLTDKLEKAGFEDLDSLATALLEEAEFQSLDAAVRAHDEHRSALAAQRQHIAGELEQQKSKYQVDESLETLQTKHHLLEAAYRQALERKGGLANQLQTNERLEAEAQQLLEQIELQELVSTRWMALNEVIGQANGKKFRVFAQGLTLERLVRLANEHLMTLNGRYFLQKRAGEVLDLEIVDTYQANNTRSMYTLSGGESFLVSLALALGLSDLAGRRANIHSLFIDEGFGTLDEATLDLALTTLENLQAQGKTIGVISHVKEIKERITTQIQLIKKGGGVSTLKVVG